MRDFYKLKSYARKGTLTGLVALTLLAGNAVPSYGGVHDVTIAEILSKHPRATVAVDSTTSVMNAKVSLNVKNLSFIEFFERLTKSSGQELFLSYLADDIKSVKPISISVEKTTVDMVLTEVLSKAGLSYAVTGNIITVKKAPAAQQPKTQLVEFKGKIVNAATKQPVAGATIIVIESDRGAISDEKGNFSLMVEPGHTMEISFIGMKTLKYKVVSGKIDNITITMDVDNLAVDDVIVTGYGTIDKKSFTGNAKTIKGDDLLKVSRTNVIKAIQSFDPSFRISENMQFGSDPNALPEVYIRGRSSLGTFDLDKDALSRDNLKSNPNTPTFIMDGFAVDIQKVYDLDPNRIQTLTILKDAAATAMYGSRAANGVVVITTIPPKDGRVRINYNLTTTFEFPDLSDYNLMNSAEKLETELLSGVFNGVDSDVLDKDGTVDYWEKWNKVYIEKIETDWLAQPLRNAFKHKHSLGIEGGTDYLRYGFNMKYTSDNGVMKESGRDNAGADLYLQFTFGKFNIRNMVSYANTWEEDSRYGGFNDYTHRMPYDRFTDEDGNLLPSLSSGSYNSESKINPLYEAKLGNYSKRKYEELINNLELRWSVNDYLLINGQLSVTRRWDKSNRFTDPYSLNSTHAVSGDNLLAGDLRTTIGDSFDMDARVGISYNRSINKHNVNFNVNGGLIEGVSNSISSHYVGFPSGKLNSVNYASKLETKPSTTEATSRSANVTGIFNYSYNNIYLMDISARLEGSSMFGENQRTAPFWAGGLGINVHNYEFMKNVKSISTLKFRGSLGHVGNINFPPYAAQNYYNTMTEDWYVTGFGTKIEYLGNPDLKIERTETLDLGFELGFLDNRFKLVGSYYNKLTKDMINDVTIPSSSGFVVYKENLGKVRNRGFEAEIYANVLQNKDYSLVLSANVARNKNTMVQINESLRNYNDRVDEHYADENLSPSRSKTQPLLKYEEGGSMTAIIAMRSLGIDPMTGREVFLDRAGNITHDWISSQQSIIGDTEPALMGNFGINARYRNFTLYASFAYEFGGQRYNQTLVDYVENAKIEEGNVDKRVLTDRWQKPGDITKLKNIKDNKETKPTSRFVQDYNLLSLSSLSLQYEFSDAIAKKLYLERMRLEASCNDVFRISSVKQERGLSYPFARSFNLSLMVNF